MPSVWKAAETGEGHGGASWALGLVPLPLGSLGLPGGRRGSMQGRQQAPSKGKGRQAGWEVREAPRSYRSAASPRTGGLRQPGCLSPFWSERGHALVKGRQGLPKVWLPSTAPLQLWLRRTLFSTCSSCLSAVPKTGPWCPAHLSSPVASCAPRGHSIQPV